VEGHLSRAWVQAVPSVWAEPFGFVAAEAMMRGSAVVATNTGGLGEIVQDGMTGRQTPPGDVEALAAALIEILSDRELAERYGAAGRAFALTHLTHGQWLDRFEALYRDMLGDDRHG
jgi:glycosyltransferase involved in cell wall biosynthesis